MGNTGNIFLLLSFCGLGTLLLLVLSVIQSSVEELREYGDGGAHGSGHESSGLYSSFNG